MAMNKDPFGFDGDKTKVVPRPGGRPLPGTADGFGEPPPGTDKSDVHSQLHEHYSGVAGANTLLMLATPLLAVMHRLRHTVSHPDPEGLREWLHGQIRVFRDRATAGDSTRHSADHASFVLCTALDEAVLNTPWGANSSWRAKNLLMLFHNQASGGDEAFARIGNLMPEAHRYTNLLELFYVCLSLGFKGRYGLVEQGGERLQGIREQLNDKIAAQREEPPADLSPNWQGVRDYTNPLARHLPLWVLGAAGLALLVGLYWLFSISVNDRSDPVLNEIGAVRIAKPFDMRVRNPTDHSEQAPRTVPTLRELLRDDIPANVDVLEEGDQAVVRLRGDGLFRSGRATVQASYLPVLTRVADALNQVQGPIVVEGHTDSIPIRSSRWPSNQVLSLGRAEGVLGELSKLLADPGRLSAKGRGHQSPIADNGSRAGRAENRRVDLRLPNL